MINLKCVNGHDLCYLGPDPNCPYCERPLKKSGKLAHSQKSKETPMLKITLLSGQSIPVTSRAQIESLYLTSQVSLTEATSALTSYLHLHPSYATIIHRYLETRKGA